METFLGRARGGGTFVGSGTVEPRRTPEPEGPEQISEKDAANAGGTFRKAQKGTPARAGPRRRFAREGARLSCWSPWRSSGFWGSAFLRIYLHPGSSPPRWRYYRSSSIRKKKMEKAKRTRAKVPARKQGGGTTTTTSGSVRWKFRKPR